MIVETRRAPTAARRLRVRALGHAAPDHQRARRHRAGERRLVARSVAAARSRTAGSTASARADTKGAIAATLVALEDEPPRDVGVLFSGDEEPAARVMHAFLASPHAQDVKRGDRVRADRAHRRHRASRRARADARRSTARAATRRRPTTCRKPIAQLARLAVALDDFGARALARRPARHDRPVHERRGAPRRRRVQRVPQRGELEWSLRPYPGFDRAAWDRDARRARSRAIDPAIALATTVDHAPFQCDGARRRRAAVRATRSARSTSGPRPRSTQSTASTRS